MPIFPPHADDVAHFISALERNSHHPRFPVSSTLATRLTGSRRGYGKVVAILKGLEEKRMLVYKVGVVLVSDPTLNCSIHPTL